MKVFTGQVIGKKMQKTATVAVERVVIHKIYKKRTKRTKKYHVHDEMGSEVGQKVRFVESKPYSRTKKWKIIEIVSKGKLAKKQTIQKKVNNKKAKKIK